MLKKPIRAGATLLLACSLTLLFACAPEFVGEAQAKRAGLALFHQAFGIVAREAHVEYFERAGSSVIDNSEVQPGAPEQIYLVTISDQAMGTDLYYAEVDAKTGIAYYASKSGWLLAPPNKDQSQQTIDSNDLSNKQDTTTATQNDSAQNIACDYLVHHFKKEVALMRSQDCCGRDHILSPRAGLCYFVTFADGALYRVGFSWPSMELNEVQALGNELDQE